jgi:signal transduction histidine kinase
MLIDTPDEGAQAPRAALLKSPAVLALCYLLVGFAWLWASTALGLRFAADLPGLAAVERAKGALFVVATAALLWTWLRAVRRTHERLPRIEGRLHDTEAQISSLLQFAPDAIVIHDANTIVYANPAFRELFRLPPGFDVAKLRLRDIVDPVDLPAMRSRVAAVASRVGIAAPREIVFRTVTGERVDVEHAGCSVLVAGRILVQSHLRDLTARNAARDELKRLNEHLEVRVRERTAELLAVNRALESFTYSVAHDLKSPVQRIGQFAAALCEQVDRGDAARTRHFASRIAANAQEMGQMIDGLLLVSRADRAPLEVTRIDHRALVAGVVAGLDERSAAAIEVGELPPAPGDATLVRQVWSNLLANAVKYSAGAAAPRVVVSGECVGAEAVYCVADNGIGFDAAAAGRLFHTFHRLSNARDYAGTGVGLSVVRRIVTRHGGRAWAQGEPGRGAQFFFSLPCGDSRKERVSA